MITAGIDVGSLTTKVVLLKDRKILSYGLLLSSERAEVTSNKAIEEGLGRANLSIKDVSYIVSTGVGREEVQLANVSITIPLAIAVGATHLFPTARTVVDMGAENCVVVTCEEKGQVMNFVMNDKCAAGTGLFLESMAEALGVRLEEMGRLSLGSKSKVNISSFCTVFAESEVVGYIHMGVNKVDIIKGLHDAVTLRVSEMLRKVRFRKDVVMGGGVARNVGVVNSLRSMIASDILVPEDPEVIGALGAAIIAYDKAKDVE